MPVPPGCKGLGTIENIGWVSIELVDYNAGKQAIADVLATGQSAILMCACKDVATCHRRTAAEQLAADLGVPITHLVPPK